MDPPGKGKQTRPPEKIRSWGWRREGGSGGRKKWREEENMREWDAQEGGRTVRERKERDILIEGAIKGLTRNMKLRKCVHVCTLFCFITHCIHVALAIYASVYAIYAYSICKVYPYMQRDHALLGATSLEKTIFFR